MKAPRLSVELIPETAFWKNVRSNVTRAEWRKCQAYARAKTDGGCIICGQRGREQGRNYDTECHEVFDYDEDEGVQTLVDIIPICPTCHAVKHLGRTREVASEAEWERVLIHLQRVNDWPDWKTEKYVVLQFQIWRARSMIDWKLDLGLLNLLGIQQKES